MTETSNLSAANTSDRDAWLDYPLAITAAGSVAQAAWDCFMVKQSAANRPAYRTTAYRFLGWLERQDIQLNVMTSQHIEAFLDSLYVTSRSKNSYRSRLLQFLATLLSTGAVGSNQGRGKARMNEIDIQSLRDGALHEAPCPAVIASAGPSAKAAWDRFIGGKSPTTIAVYRTIASRFLAWLERQGTGLAEMTSDHIEQFLATLDLTTSSRQSYRSPLRQFLAALVQTGALAPSPNDSGQISQENQAPGDQKASDAGQHEKQFAALTDIEKQATVDAAAMALTMGAIEAWLSATDPSHAARYSVDVSSCEKTLELGERYGITPISWIESAGESKDQQ